MRKILAFTLAEMLIVISIIGVVSAISLPNLNHSTHQTANKSKLKKFYAEMTDAWGRMEGVYGKFENWNEEEQFLDFQESKQSVLMERLQDFLKVKRVAIENSRVRQVQCKDWFYYMNDGYVFFLDPYLEETSYDYGKDYDERSGDVTIKELNYGGKIIKCYGVIVVTTEPDLRKTQQNTSLANYVKRYRFYITEEGLIPVGSQGIICEEGDSCHANGENLEEQYNNCIKKTYAQATCTGPLVEY